MRRGSGALGWILFALIFFAPRIAGPLSAWLAQTFGVTIAPGSLIAGMIGLYVLFAVLGPGLRALGRSRNGSADTRLPTSAAPPPTVAPPRPAQLPPASPQRPPSAVSAPTVRLPGGPSPLPGPPRFEPIINPLVLTFGIIGLLVLGAFLLIALFLAGSLP